MHVLVQSLWTPLALIPIHFPGFVLMVSSRFSLKLQLFSWVQTQTRGTRQQWCWWGRGSMWWIFGWSQAGSCWSGQSLSPRYHLPPSMTLLKNPNSHTRRLCRVAPGCCRTGCVLRPSMAGLTWQNQPSLFLLITQLYMLKGRTFPIALQVRTAFKRHTCPYANLSQKTAIKWCLIWPQNRFT